VLHEFEQLSGRAQYVAECPAIDRPAWVWSRIAAGAAASTTFSEIDLFGRPDPAPSPYCEPASDLTAMQECASSARVADHLRATSFLSRPRRNCPSNEGRGYVCADHAPVQCPAPIARRKLAADAYRSWCGRWCVRWARPILNWSALEHLIEERCG